MDVVVLRCALGRVVDRDRAWPEIRRVLRPGGTFLILEATRPQSRWRYGCVRFYLKRVAPAIARLGGHDARTIMRYFWDTIDACVPPDTIVDSLAAAGFVDPQRGGELELFAEYTATKPA